jgi:hypothetical protein
MAARVMYRLTPTSLRLSPLSALWAKRGILFFFLYPLCGEAGERVVQRSVDRVSRLRRYLITTKNKIMATQESHLVQLPFSGLLKVIRRLLNRVITMGKCILGEPPCGRNSINHILAFTHR